MLTYLVRHARTAYSAAYRVNGRPEPGVRIDQVGEAQCRLAQMRYPWQTIASCVVSDFPRTSQTADLLVTNKIVPRYVDKRLGEIDYGIFEGQPFLEYGRWLDENGPWRRPPGSPESQREAILRMLDGLRNVLTWPGPRLVVAHGLLVSVVQQASISGVYFPEAPYVTPIQLSDDRLRRLTTELTEEIDQEWAGQTPEEAAASISADTGRRSC
jgi:probable phosphoglycerate mutase